MEKLEEVQRFAMRLVPELGGMNYEDILTLEVRMVEMIITSYTSTILGTENAENRSTNTVSRTIHRNIRNYFFSFRIVVEGNERDEETNFLHSFKTRYE